LADMRGGRLFAIVALGAAASANAGTLWVAFPSGAEPCGYDQLAAALHARLGDVSVRPGVHDVMGDDVDVALERSGSDWGLRVRAAGEQELERKLPRPGTDCVATTETAALMVERYLDDIRWTGGGAVVQRLPPLPPKPPPPPWQMVLEVGGAGALLVPQVAPNLSSGSGQPIPGPGGILDIGVRWGNWQAELSGGYFQLPEQNLGGNVYTVKNGSQPATLQWFVVPVELALGHRFSTGFGAFRLEVAPGAELYQAQPANLYNGTTQLAVLPSVGLRLGYDFPIWKRLFLTLGAEVRAHGAKEFLAIGLETVSTGFFDGNAILTLGYVFF
jgi:hypothetical protein